MKFGKKVQITISGNNGSPLFVNSTGRDTRRVEMTGPTGTHSVNLVDKNADEYLGRRYARAIVHVIGFLERNGVELAEIARAVTHISQDTVDNFGPSMTFCHAEFKRGVRLAWLGMACHRKGADTYGRNGYNFGRKLLKGGYAPASRKEAA